MKNLSPRAHELLSRRVLLPVSRFQRIVRPSRRAVIRAYYEGMKFRRRAEGWILAEKTSFLLQRMRNVVRRAYADTSYYHELFDRIGFDPGSEFGFDEFALLPVLEREDVRKGAGALLSNRLPF